MDPRFAVRWKEETAVISCRIVVVALYIVSDST
jgi:hypothetical protein